MSAATVSASEQCDPYQVTVHVDAEALTRDARGQVRIADGPGAGAGDRQSRLSPPSAGGLLGCVSPFATLPPVIQIAIGSKIGARTRPAELAPRPCAGVLLRDRHGRHCDRGGSSFFVGFVPELLIALWVLIVVQREHSPKFKELDEAVAQGLSSRQCPQCGRPVQVGVLDGPDCGFEFRTIGQWANRRYLQEGSPR